MENVAKYNTTTFKTGEIITGMSEEDFSCRSKGEYDTYQEHLRQHIPFPDCRVELTYGYMKYHCRRLHGTETDIDWD